MSSSKSSDVQVIESPNSLESTMMLIQERVKNSDNAFYQVNLGHVLKQFIRWKKLVPRVQPFFAIKCQPDPKVISILGQLGAGFDCASMKEVKTVVETLSFEADVASRNIIYANPFKFKKDIQYSQNVGVSMTTFDTESELLKLSKEWPSAQLVLRLSTPKAYQATCVLGNKFGVDTNEVTDILRRAKELSMNIIGFSFHVGSGCKELDAFPETVMYCSEVVTLARQFGFNPYLIDIGGGFPGLSEICDDISKQADFERMCSKLNSVLDSYFPESDNYRIISEPGRYFVLGAYTLTTQVIGRRSLDILNPLANQAMIACNKDNDVNTPVVDVIQQGYRYVINDGVYNSFNCIVFDHANPKPFGIFTETGLYRSIDNDNNSSSYVSTMYGPTCDGFDCILQQVPLPKINVGEWIVWPNMGAYTIAASSCFNGIPMADIFYYFCREDLLEMEKYCQPTLFQPQFEE